MKLISKSPRSFTVRIFRRSGSEDWLAVLAFAVSYSRAAARDGIIPMLVIPLVMAGFGYVLMKTLVFDLVDEVWDADTDLFVRNKGREIRC